LQALIELIAGFIALLAAAALSQFGVDLHRPSAPEREVHRVVDCPQAPARNDMIASPSDHC
jgi:hypothetical protein